MEESGQYIVGEIYVVELPILLEFFMGISVLVVGLCLWQAHTYFPRVKERSNDIPSDSERLGIYIPVRILNLKSSTSKSMD